VPLQAGSERLAGFESDKVRLPPGALALFLELRSGMHGFVMLELLGRLAPMNDYSEDLFRGMMSRSAAQLAAIRDAAG
jgi:hypothetical protein